MWWKRVAFQNYFLAAVALSIVSAAGILVTKSFLPPLIPLFYGKPTGVEQLASAWFIFLIPAASVLITGINLLIIISVQDDFIKKILAVGTLIISIMAAVTVVKIVLLVGFF